MGTKRPQLGPSWPQVGVDLAQVAARWALESYSTWPLEPNLVPSWPILASTWPNFAPLGPKLGQVGVMWAIVGGR